MKVAIIGTGYVGLPTGIGLSELVSEESGFRAAEFYNRYEGGG